MGSCFLHDDYRLPEVAGSLPYKKDNNSAASSSNGIFENNPCFASIKKELGFMDDCTVNSMAGEEDIYADTRARSSPVVERLILQEIQNDIAEYAANIGISTDPELWRVNDTRKWLQWVASIYQLGDLSESLSYDGNTLCNFSEGEFILLTGSTDTGLKIAAQLDLWKNAIKMTPSAGSYHFQHQQMMDCKFGTPQGRVDSGTPKLLAVSCSWSATNTSSSSATYTNTEQYNNSNTEYYGYNNQPNSQPYPQYPQNHAAPACFPQEEVRCLPRPTIPLDRFAQYREACQSNTFSAAHTYQRYTDVSQPGPAFQKQKGGFNLPKQTRDPNLLKGFPDILNEVPKECLDSLLGEKTYTVDPKESLKALAILSMPAESNIKEEAVPSGSEPGATNKSAVAETVTAPKLEIKKEKIEEPESPDMEMEKFEGPETQAATATATKPPQRKKSSKHPIHLWEFLKQLLNEGKDCIRWLDQEKGVFKIYNSQQVAKFWGERKNRPAMNYDKLSRSIRQYYKKGIIKKTSQGKRLVYQFCDAYL